MRRELKTMRHDRVIIEKNICNIRDPTEINQS